ncbi:MAG TPA: sulfatase [Thermoanaerobaculia bacterium]|nr:sulfatase [Thermoanaerobaculia bacterium]
MTCPDVAPGAPPRAVVGRAARAVSDRAARPVLVRTLPAVVDRAVGRALVRAVLAGCLLLASCLLLAGCHRAPPDGFVLRPLVAAGRYTLAGGLPGGTGKVGAGEPAGGAGGEVEGLRFAARPALGDLEIDHERRPVVLTPPGAWSWTGRVPPGAALHAGMQLVPAAWQWVRRLQAAVTVRDGRSLEVLQVVRTAERVDPAWLDLSADLTPYAGRRVTVELAVTLGGLPARLRGADLVAWGPVALTGAGGSGWRSGPAGGAGTATSTGGADRLAGTAAGAAGTAVSAAGTAPPNVILILVDTLRRDRLTPYGYRLETSPAIASRLAAPGTVMENAYSQAPWTLPSVVALMTGRYPGELLGADLSAYGIPAAISPLAERLARAGYETGGFLANPTLHVGTGFERGFHTFYAPPADVEWLRHHADDLNRHALPWLAAHQDQATPFFLYLHYIDPHDPYENPDTAGNHSPFEGEYRGEVTGDWVHGLYTGKRVLADPAKDLAHLSALYDAEVHYVDRAIGQVLASVRPEVLANTLVVLTADHGEELLDHGGWKHGQSLYDEQIHVPLIWRWDGRIPAGRRLAGTVRLVDVAPTVAAAAGAAPDPGCEGFDLLPALTGAAPLAERPAFAEGLAGGPLRAAAVLGRLKLMVFNREEPFAPSDELQGYLWRKDLGRLPRIGLFDLAQDPAERHNLLDAAGGGGPAAAAGSVGAAPASGAGAPAGRGGDLAAERLPLLATVIERRLDPAIPGLRLVAAGLRAGSRLRLDLMLSHPPRRWLPYLLTAADRVTLDGAHLTLELAGDDWLARGVTIEDGMDAPPGAAARTGAVGSGGLGSGGAGGLGYVGSAAAAGGAASVVQSLAATVDGLPLPAARVRTGAGAIYAGGPLSLAALRTRQWPGALPVAEGPVVQIWIHDESGGPQRRVAHDAETERRLRALGYIQ